MNTIELALAIITAIAAGMLLSWLLVKAHWAPKLTILQAACDDQQNKIAEQTLFLVNAEKAMRDAFGSLAADALHKNNQAFVTLAESRLSEKVTEAKGIHSRVKKRQSDPTLIEEAIRHKIIFATPTTLITLLRTN